MQELECKTGENFEIFFHSSWRVGVQLLTLLFLIEKVLGSSLFLDTYSANSELSTLLRSLIQTP